MNRTKLLVVYGTRPEAIKLAPVVHQLQRRQDEFDLVQCSTGQHRQMLEQVTDYFQLRPDVQLDLMLPEQTLAGLHGRLLTQLDAVVELQRPHAVVVQGDTTSCMAASTVAFYRQLRTVHVEAGLRTGDLAAPWPEEFNRRVTGLIADLHCAPTRQAAANLLREGIPEASIHVTGNTVIDALLWTVRRERASDANWRDKFPMFNRGDVVLVTAHRRESFGRGLENICLALSQLAARFAQTQFVYPVHLNPHVRRPVMERLGRLSNVHLLDPLPYPQFVWMMDRAKIIVTDSGGVQEEAPSLKTPVVVMRQSSERNEAVEAGAVKLVGTCVQSIVQTVANLLEDAGAYRRMQIDENPYGDGHAAERIVQLISQHVPAATLDK